MEFLCVPLAGKGYVNFYGRDVTEARRAEQELTDSRQRLSGIVQSAMDAIITIDEQQRIILFNPAAERMFRCPAEQALGGPIDRFIPQRFHEVHRQHIQQFAQTGSTARAMGHMRPLNAVRADGEEFPIEASISQVRVDHHRLFSVILRDITERQRADTALRESERRFRGTFENAAVGIAHVDADGRLLRVNQKFCEALGYGSEELVGRRFMELTHPDERELDMSQFSALMRGEIESYAMEKRYQCKDGRWIWVLVTRGLQRDEAGHPAYSISIVQDISQRKAAEQELKAAWTSAERAKSIAEQASVAKDQFLAVLSHELRTPLTPVLMTARLLERDASLSEPMRDQIEMIRRNVELEARLIDDLLDVTRISRGKVELDRKSIALCKVIHQAVEIVRADIDARGLHLGVDLGDAAPYIIHADSARLQQVFWNLLKNAVKFTPHGGCVGIRCRLDDHSVLAEVIDSGEGIDPALLPRIFNPFEQGGARMTRQFGGLGLGLTITKALVELHGGSIEAHSDGKGKGATFRIRLPIHAHGKPALPVHIAAIEAEGAPAARLLRILLVEDHGDTARIMRRLLMGDGHEVETATDVSSALALAETGPFDLLLSDLGLPDGSGIDLMRELRRRGNTLPGIALSGYGREEDMRHSREAGFAVHLTKPTSPEKLAEAIAMVVKGASTAAG
jgi:two-component system CheB/CheR fusion protein